MHVMRARVPVPVLALVLALVLVLVVAPAVLPTHAPPLVLEPLTPQTSAVPATSGLAAAAYAALLLATTVVRVQARQQGTAVHQAAQGIVVVLPTPVVGLVGWRRWLWWYSTRTRGRKWSECIRVARCVSARTQRVCACARTLASGA